MGLDEPHKRDDVAGQRVSRPREGLKGVVKHSQLDLP